MDMCVFLFISRGKTLYLMQFFKDCSYYVLRHYYHLYFSKILVCGREVSRFYENRPIMDAALEFDINLRISKPQWNSIDEN